MVVAARDLELLVLGKETADLVQRLGRDDEVKITMKAPERAATLEPEGWSEAGKYLCLLMPLRLVD